MTDEVTRISLAVDSRQVRSAEGDLKRMARAGDESARSAGGMQAAFAKVGPALSVLALGVIAQRLVQQADVYATMNARLRLVTTSATEFLQVQRDLFNIAQQTGTGLEQTTDLYGSLARSTEALGISQRDVLGVTQTISQALAVSGTSAQAAQAALVQLGQAFASGTLRGEELNSVLEQAPALARAIAAGLGTSVGALRELGKEGKLTATDVFGALQKSASQVSAEFAQLPLTVSRASTQAANSLLKLIGTLDNATGATQGLASIISGAAGLMSELADEIDRASAGQERAVGPVGLLAEAFLTLRSAVRLLYEDASFVFKEIGQQIDLLANEISGLNDLDIVIFDVIKEAVSILYANVKFVFQGIGREIGAVAAQIVALANLDIQGFNAISTAVRADAQKARLELDLLEQRILKRYNFSDKAGGGRGTAPDPRSLGEPDAIPKPRAVVAAGKQLKQDKSGEQLAKAQLQAELANIKAALTERSAAYANSERIIEAMRQASLITEAEYYEAKRGFIALDVASEVAAANAEIARLEQQKLTGAEQVNNLQAIADARARLALAQADAAAKSTILAIEEASAVQKVAIAYEQAEAAARALLDAQGLQQERALATIGKGGAERDRQAGRQQIEDRYAQQRQQLEIQNRAGDIDQQQYSQELERLRRFQSAALASYDTYYGKLKSAQADWANGSSEAIANYLDETTNVAKQVGTAFTSAFKAMEDALVRFATTGKLDFKTMANSIIADLVRIIVQQQIMIPLIKAMGGGGGGGGSSTGNFVGAVLGSIFGGGRATGGSVSKGRLYEINENKAGPGEILNAGGRQYLMAAKDGSVTPMNGTPAGGQTAMQAPVIVNNHINVGEGVSVAQVRAAMDVTRRQTIAEIRELRMRGATA
jgi:lambda family phage tail tape measure protein